MKNKGTLLLACLAVLVLAFAYYLYAGFQTTAKEDEAAGPTMEAEAKTTMKKGDMAEEHESIRSDVQVKKELPLAMNEYDVQRVIHHMSHAKVYADKKWGHYAPTKERVSRLIEVLQNEPTKYKHYDLHMDILDDWQEGDFTNAVWAHNRIWTMQGGTIGKATRLLTEKEQEAYRKKYLD